jgi:hypothetical protein
MSKHISCIYLKYLYKARKQIIFRCSGEMDNEFKVLLSGKYLLYGEDIFVNCIY